MITTLFFLSISIVNGAENAYQILAQTLPSPLMSHITAIYQDNLYIFGGKNSTGVWNNQFWKLPLSGKFTLNSAKDDVTVPSTNWDWIPLAVTAPDYGDCTTNEFVCEGQCSVLIGNYLYIVNPYSSTSSTANSYVPNAVYRLDLSASIPAFSAESTTFTPLTYTTEARDGCVTAVNDQMYVMTGVFSSTFSLESVVYDGGNDPSTTTQTNLADLSAGTGRFYAGCAPNIAGDKIYLAGGWPDPAGVFNSQAAPGIDTYDITADTWSDNVATNEFDTQNGDDKNSRRKMKCFSRYGITFECVGGWTYGLGALASSIVWNYEDRSEEKVSLATAVYSSGLEVYEILDEEVGYDVSIVLVSGGTDDLNALDIMQYAVRAVEVTASPTSSPVQAPSETPTPDPTLCPTCTALPTGSPTKTPVDVGDGGSGSIQIDTFLSLIITAVYIGYCVNK